MRTLLVTGVSGFLGWNIARVARHDWNVVGTYYTTKSHIVEQHFAPIETGRVDLTDFREMRDMMAMVKPHAVIHTAALADPNYCESHPTESFRTNVEATRNLAGLCADRGLPFVFTSTDLVFDGTKAPYAEEAVVSPINVYGEHKAMAEMEVLERHTMAAICRMPLMFGLPSPVHGSFLQWIVGKLQRGESVPLFTDEYRTPVDAESAARGLLLAARSGLPEAEEEELSWISGLLHLGGRERISRYDFGVMARELLGLTSAPIQPISLGDVSFDAQRSPDVSLESSKAYTLGYDPLPLRAALARVFGLSLPAAPANNEEDA
jgi:dTDP-4-dehydrorhamnose reductase